MTTTRSAPTPAPVGDLVHVEMFGGFSLRIGDEAVPSISGRQAVSLLAYLIYRRDRQHTRDLLVGQFWPDLDEVSARKRLSHALWQIGAVFDRAGIESILVRKKDTVSLRSDIVVVIDTELFDNRLDDFEDQLLGDGDSDSDPNDISALAAVVSNYEDFLAGYYTDWIEHERTRLAGRRLHALNLLVRLFKRRGNYDVALRYVHQLVAADPLREESHREVMRICGLMGHVSGAKHQYQQCCDVLKKELGVEPSAETTELVRRVEREASVGGVPDVASAGEPLFGRAQVLSDLWTQVEALIEGRGGVVLLEGELGMGKSRVIAELTEGARWRGAEVISASHNDRNRWVPYGALCEAIEPWCTGFKGDHVAELLDPLWVSIVRKFIPTFGEGMETPPISVPPILRGDEEIWRSAEGLARVVLALGQVRPTVLVLEDLQWADQETSRTLRLLSKDLAESGVLLCLTYRRSEAQQAESVWSGLSDLGRVDCSTRLELEPLSEDNMHRLLSSRSAGEQLTDEASARLLDVVSGNPLFAIQVLEHPEFLAQKSLGEPDIEEVAVDVMAEVVAQRLASAPEEVRAVLQILAVLAEPSGSRSVARLLEASRTTVTSAMHEGVRSRFLAETVDGCEFVNKETRRLVYEAMPNGRREELHSRVLDYWLAVGGESRAVLGNHAWEAGRWAEAAGHHCQAAFDDIELNAFKTAATHFDMVDQASANQGLSLLDWFDDALVYEDALNTVSWRDKQQTLIDRLLEQPLDDEQLIRVELRQVRHLALTFSGKTTTEAAKRVVARAEKTGLLLNDVLASVGTSLFVSGYTELANETLARAREVLDPGSDEWAEVSLRYFIANSDRESADSFQDLVESVAAWPKYQQNLQFQVDGLRFEAVGQLYRGEVDRSIKAWKQAIDLSKQIGYLRGEVVGYVNLGAGYGYMAQAGLAVQAFEKGAALLPVLGDERGTAFVSLGLGELYHRLIGDDKKARTLLNEAAALFRSMDDVHSEYCALDILARVDLRAGSKARARKLLCHVLERSDDLDFLWGEVQAQTTLSEVLVQTGEFQAAIEAADRAIECAEELENERFMPGPLSVKAVALLGLGQRTEAIGVVKQVLAKNSEAGFFPHISAWRVVAVLRRGGESALADQQVEFAYEVMERSLEGLSPELMKTARQNVPEHRAIQEAYAKLKPLVRQCRWPRHSTEESVSDVGYIEVDLTVSAPEDSDWPTEVERRRHRVQRIWHEAQAQGVTPRPADVAELLEVSEKTIKRDLASGQITIIDS